MNLMGREPINKKWIFIALAVIVVIALIILFIFRGKPNDPKTDDPTTDITQPTDDDYTGHGNGLTTDWGDDYTDEEVDVIIVNPTDKSTGTVKSYTDNSTSAELVISKDGKEETYQLTPNGIVFDATTNKVVTPSTLKDAKDIEVLYRTSISGETTAEVVIKNTPKGINYTPVMRMVKSKEGVYLVNDVTQTKYQLEESTQLVNALTGTFYNRSDLKPGDRTFIYSESTNTLPERPKFELYPGDIGNPLPPDYYKVQEVTPDDKLHKYKTIKSQEIYVYPYYR